MALPLRPALGCLLLALGCLLLALGWGCGSRTDLGLGGGEPATFGSGASVSSTGGQSAAGGAVQGTGGQGTGGDGWDGCAGLGEVDCLHAVGNCAPRYRQTECGCQEFCADGGWPAASYEACVPYEPACDEPDLRDSAADGCFFTPAWACEAELTHRCDFGPAGASAGCGDSFVLRDGGFGSVGGLHYRSCYFAWFGVPDEVTELVGECPEGWVLRHPGVTEAVGSAGCIRPEVCEGERRPECRRNADCPTPREGCSWCQGGRCTTGSCECRAHDARIAVPFRGGGLPLGWAYDGVSCQVVFSPCDGSDCDELPANNGACRRLRRSCEDAVEQ